MTVRAVIFDVYHTLLRLSPPPADAGARWARLLESNGLDERLSMEEFAARCQSLIEREHANARAAGVANPEVVWSELTREALPALAHLSGENFQAFLLEHARLQRTVALMPGAPELVRALRERNLPLGIASNAQGYTLGELDDALLPAGFSRQIFDPALQFWSFQNGFSKPNPHVFRILGARLLARGIQPAEILMVGDRADNDIEPARAHGWRTWRVTDDPSPEECGGSLGELLAWITKAA
jgi:putative hydrolase of the HAD superfamily